MQSKKVTQAPILSRNEIIFRALVIVVMLTTFLWVHALLLQWLPQAFSIISQSN
jgi:hypothetical protein